MLKELKKRVAAANRMLTQKALVIETFGNVSGVDRESGQMVIKPSGVHFDELKAKQMVVVSLADGEVVEGDLRPSSDTPTHLHLYRSLKHIGGIVHTHSLYATAWAQSCRDLPALGTTHADYFYGAVPCTRALTDDEIAGDYELNTGKIIVERLSTLDAAASTAMLVACHGPFVWGDGPEEAVRNAVILEHLARLASETLRIDPAKAPMPKSLMERHFFRKHGDTAYYGQK